MARKEFGIFDKVYSNKSPKTNKTVYRYRFYWYQTPETKERKYGYSDYCSTKEQAKQNAQNKIDEKFYGKKENNKSLSIEQVAEKYVEYITNLEISEKVRPVSQAVLVSNMNTLVLNKDERGRNIAHIPAELRKRKIKDFSTADMSNWLNYLITTKSYKTGQRLGERTVKKMKKTIRKLLIYANKELNCFEDDGDKATLLYVKTSEDIYVEDTSIPPKDKSYRVLDEKMFREFMKSKTTPNGFYESVVVAEKGEEINKDYEYYILLNMLFYSGARISEVKPLTVEDIDWETKEEGNRKTTDIYKANIRFSKTYSEKCLKATKEKHRNQNNFMKTPKSNRKIPIYGIYAQELFRYVRYLKTIYGRDYNGLLFRGEKNAVMSSNAIQNKINKHTENLKEYGIDKLSPHDFRASRVTEFLNTGLEPKDIYWFFGHDSQKLVDGCYKRVRPEKEYELKKGFANKTNFGDDEQQKIIDDMIKKQLKIN